jgi:plastocyanin
MSPSAAGRAVALGALGAVLLAAPASAGIEQRTYVERDGENRFGPRVKTANLGESVFSWVWEDQPTARQHNVRQDRRLFRSGDPVMDPAAPFFLSASAGTHHYYCEVHGSRDGGMEGRIRVRPAALPPELDRSFVVRWAIGGEALRDVGAAGRWGSQGPTVTGDRFDVRFKVEDGDWRTWRTDTSKVEARFGRDDNPVHVGIGKTYRFRARSQQGPSPDRRSGWSPRLTVIGAEGM